MPRQAARRPRGRGRGARRRARAADRGLPRPGRPPYDGSRKRRSSARATSVGEKVATRGAYGDALAWLGSIDEPRRRDRRRGRQLDLRGALRREAPRPLLRDVRRRAADGRRRRRPADPGPEAVRLLVRRFLSRAYDFIRMAASPTLTSSSAAPISASRSGPTAPHRWRSKTSPRCAPSSTASCSTPRDANQTVALLDAMREHRGLSYLRTTRGATPIDLRARRELRDRRQPARCAPSDDDP